MGGVIAIIKRLVHRLAAYVVASFLRPGATYDPVNFRLWERRGYHITPTHFYYPIPDTRELEKLEFQPSKLPGINLRPEFQLSLLEREFVNFSQEYNTLPIKPAGQQGFYLDNDAFNGIDPFVFYSMIRHFKPKTVVEVGSGHSTLLGAQACQVNGVTRYVCIDPWPRDFIAKGVPDVEFVRKKVEDIDMKLFQQLREGDILFIDNSHVIRTAGDVCFMILEVLPRLAKGVIVHLHDIFLPFDYPKELIVRHQMFWTEQYLLQAYLAENQRTEILAANYFLSTEYPLKMREFFPKALQIRGASFYIRKC